MVDDYELRMGGHHLIGRDGAHAAATAKQFRQFPGLALTAHDVVLGEDRIAMRFTEHGRSTISKEPAAWSGVSMYRWNGEKRKECRVEQDYYARREQLWNDVADVVSAPAVDPWSEQPQAASDNTDRLVCDWLLRGELFASPIGSRNNEHRAKARRIILADHHVPISDLFAAGPRAAFYAVIRGRYRGGFDTITSMCNPTSKSRSK